MLLVLDQQHLISIWPTCDVILILPEIKIVMQFFISWFDLIS